MMDITFQQILQIIGKLDDAPGDNTPRERFRLFLHTNATKVGDVRDSIEECLRNSGEQYNRALQDLVNHLGRFLGFTVTPGRYQGVHGQPGFDGHWESPKGFHLVVEVKTSETYPIKTTMLVGYIDALISEKKIPNWEHALGLYVIGRPDPAIRQLENAILAEKRTHQLRLISVESLLSLAELMTEHDVSHEDVLAVIRPSEPIIDPVVDLMARLVAEPQATEFPRREELPPTHQASAGEAAYWLTPVKSDTEATAEEVIQTLVGQERVYAFGERTPGRTLMKPGDWICFYATRKGVVAHAKVTSSAEKRPYPHVRHPEKYPWVFRLDDERLYLDEPVVIDAAVRSQLDAFHGKDPTRAWAWFVQATHRLTAHDFRLLTRS